MTAISTSQTNTTLQTWRCRTCGRILLRCELGAGSTLEIKCKCNTVTTITVPRIDKGSDKP